MLIRNSENEADPKNVAEIIEVMLVSLFRSNPLIQTRFFEKCVCTNNLLSITEAKLYILMNTLQNTTAC